MSWEQLEHTADIRIKVKGGCIGDLILSSGAALSSFLGANPNQEDHPDTRMMKVDNAINFNRTEHMEMHLHSVLRELLYLKETEDFNFCTATFTREDDQRPVSNDNARITIFHGYIGKTEGEEIKAVTYHNFHITHTKEGYETEIIFDI